MDKLTLSAVEQIEYYLGKDRLPNLHWQAKLPESWEIQGRKGRLFHSETIKNSTVVDPVNTEIVYRFNNLGFRADVDYTDDLKDKNIILVVGCSDTFGRLVEYENIYSSKLQKACNAYTVINMSTPGASPDMITRFATQTIKYLQVSVKHLCLVWPPFSIREFVSKTFKSGITVHEREFVPYADWWDHIDWVSNNYNYQKNKILLQSICGEYKIGYHDLIINRDDTKIPYDFIPCGPFTSIGPKTHAAVANYFYKKITNLPNLYEQLKILQS